MTPTETLREFATHGVPNVHPHETAKDFFTRLGLLSHGFSFGEIVASTRKDNKEPIRLEGHMYRMAMTLAFANVFRQVAMQECGILGINIAAAFRPSGGEDNSQHKHAAALDLDKIKGPWGSGGKYFKCAVKMWCEWGQQLSLGLGLYTWSRWNTGGLRVHFDTDYRCRSWQGVSLGPKFQRPYKIKCNDGRTRSLGLPVKLATDMGLDVPSLEYL